MSRATPSLTALLGLLAVAGYQNRDKIADMLRGASGDAKNPASGESSGGLGSIGAMLGGAGAAGGAGGLLSTGLKDLLARFNASGDGDTADSWVQTGPNKQCSPESLRRGLGSETLADLRQRTGLSEDEIVTRLCKNLPDAVDKYTPDGRI
jgi:uncharacterized protein YidB (DUF937 family)